MAETYAAAPFPHATASSQYTQASRRPGQDCVLLLIIEVLSPSTESWDRGGKFSHYRSLPSLADYVLVSQDRILVEHFRRQPDHRWLLTAASSLDDVVEISLGARLILADIYERVPGLNGSLAVPNST